MHTANHTAPEGETGSLADAGLGPELTEELTVAQQLEILSRSPTAPEHRFLTASLTLLLLTLIGLVILGLTLLVRMVRRRSTSPPPWRRWAEDPALPPPPPPPPNFKESYNTFGDDEDAAWEQARDEWRRSLHAARSLSAADSPPYGL